MPKQKRNKTKYPGVYFVNSTAPETGKPDKIFYIRYKVGGKTIEEKAGRSVKDAMTPAKAASLRGQRAEGKSLSNKARRTKERAEKDALENRWTISRLWEEYKAQKAVNKALLVDDGRVKKYLIPNLGEKTPNEIITLDVDRLRVNLLKKKKLAPQTVKHVLGLLKRIVRFGWKKSLTPIPEFSITMPEVNNTVMEDLSESQLKRLVKAIDEDPNKKSGAIMKLAMTTGMRRGEIFKLEWADVDFDRQFITIRDPKGGKDQRIPLNASARSVLESVERTEGVDLVFSGKGGKPLQNIYPYLRRIKEKAGLPPSFRPLHGLRHAYASALASSGKVDMQTLQALLTHKSPTMTQRYAHLRDEALKRAGDVAGEIFNVAVNSDS